MSEKLRGYLDSLFADAPRSRQAAELKDELLANLTEKYNDLLAQGQSEESAYRTAIENIGDVEELIDVLRQQSVLDPVATQKREKRSGLITAIAVMLYILCPVPVIVLGSSMSGRMAVIGVALLLFIVAVATGLLVYNGTSKRGYNRYDDTLVEEFKEWKGQGSSRHAARKALKGAVWSVITACYLISSILLDNWAYSWILFIVGAAIWQIIDAYYQLKE